MKLYRRENKMDNKTKLLEALIAEHERLGVGGRSLTGLANEIGIEVTRKELVRWFDFERPLRYKGYCFYYQSPCAGLPPTLAILKE